MNLRKTLNILLGWCPGYKSASKFKTRISLDLRNPYHLASMATITVLSSIILYYVIFIRPPIIGEAVAYRSETITLSHSDIKGDNINWYTVRYEVTFDVFPSYFKMTDYLQPNMELNNMLPHFPLEFLQYSIDYDTETGRVDFEIQNPHPVTSPLDNKFGISLGFNNLQKNIIPESNNLNISYYLASLEPFTESEFFISIDPINLTKYGDFTSSRMHVFFGSDEKVELIDIHPSGNFKEGNVWETDWYHNRSEKYLPEHNVTYSIVIPDRFGFDVCVYIKFRDPLFGSLEPIFEGVNATFQSRGYGFWDRYRINLKPYEEYLLIKDAELALKTIQFHDIFLTNQSIKVGTTELPEMLVNFSITNPSERSLEFDINTISLFCGSGIGDTFSSSFILEPGETRTECLYGKLYRQEFSKYVNSKTVDVKRIDLVIRSPDDENNSFDYDVYISKFNDIVIYIR